jgi:hypothetical protein
MEVSPTLKFFPQQIDLDHIGCLLICASGQRMKLHAAYPNWIEIACGLTKVKCEDNNKQLGTADVLH